MADDNNVEVHLLVAINHNADRINRREGHLLLIDEDVTMLLKTAKQRVIR